MAGTVDVFIRTYEKDIKWLTYCLASIQKYLTGYRNIIICIPEGQQHLLSHLTLEKVVTCPVYEDDYLGQQISKMLAYKYTDADKIFYMDSDLILLRPVDISECEIDGKPIIYKTDYKKAGDAIIWKKVTEKYLGIEISHEYMRRHPFLYLRETLENIDRDFPVEEYVTKQPYRQFSEFNAIGAYIDINEKEKYSIIDTETISMPEPFLKQFWSWSGLTSKEKKEIELILK